LWDDSGLAGEFAADDEIANVEAEVIVILKTSNDLQPFYGKQ
jgi:hypothetical protein